MRTIAYTPEALDDLEDIFAYIARDNPHAARRARERVRATVEALAFMPAARAGRVQGTCEMPVTRLPYIVAFELPDEATLRVLRIIHMSRDWPEGGWPEG